jgi:ribonuclease VapC
MFIDASALCAVLLREPDADIHAGKMDQASSILISSLAVYETVLALARSLNGDVAAARRIVSGFVRSPKVNLVEVGAAEQEIALDAFDRYGKGRHPARLNMGDCFAYACARTQGVPLLFKGDDFGQTDIAVA